jgi:DNA-directed RNA polymerase subunit beta
MYRDSSLKAPPGMKGVVVETRIFSRKDRSDKKNKAEDQETINGIKEKFQAEIDGIKIACRDNLVQILNGQICGRIP